MTFVQQQEIFSPLCALWPLWQIVFKTYASAAQIIFALDLHNSVTFTPPET